MAYKVHTVDGKSGEVDLSHARKQSRVFTMATPVAGNHVIWRAPVACTITKVQAYTTGGTSTTVNASTAGGDVLSTNLASAAGAWSSSNANQNTAMAVGDTLTAKITAQAGNPTELCLQVEYTVNVP